MSYANKTNFTPWMINRTYVIKTRQTLKLSLVALHILFSYTRIYINTVQNFCVPVGLFQQTLSGLISKI